MPQRPSHATDASLAEQLESLWREYDHRFLATDPVAVPHEFADPADQEVVALVAAVLAYGNVRQILRSVRDAVGRLGEHHAARLREFASGLASEPVGSGPPRGKREARRIADREREAQRLARGFRHRFNGEHDLARLWLAIGRALREYGSLEALFLRAHDPAAPNIGPALEAFARALLEPPHGGAQTANTTALSSPLPSLPATFRSSPSAFRLSSFDFFLPLPSRGSACKRLNLFLRWMVRSADGVDFGLWRGVQASDGAGGWTWRGVRPAQLLMPLDTHVWRIARALGLTTRRAADWRAAVEITDALRRIDPEDPVRFDFAIARLGIVGRCRRAALDPAGCRTCVLRGACREAKP